MHKIAVSKLDLHTGKKIKTYESLMQASEENYISIASIRRALSGRYKQAGGYRWSLAQCNAYELQM